MSTTEPYRFGLIDHFVVARRTRMHLGKVSSMLCFFEQPSADFLCDIFRMKPFGTFLRHSVHTRLSRVPISTLIDVEVRSLIGQLSQCIAECVQRTVNQQLDSRYGPSEDQVGVWHSGPIEIINAYDSQHRLAFDTGKPKFGPAAYVWAYLPFWKQLMFPDSQGGDDPEVESAQFRRAVAIAGVDSSISDRMEKLCDLDVAVSELQAKRFSEACAHDCTEADLEKIPNPAGDDWRKPLVPTLRDWLNAYGQIIGRC